MTDDEFEACILAFEQSWQRGDPDEIAVVLGRALACSAPERGRLVVELICIDLEYRGRSRRPEEPVRLERYAPLVPELGPLEGWPLELIGEEYRVRRRWGDRPAHPEIVSRFPARRQEIVSALARIDRELEEESNESGTRPGRAFGVTTAHPVVPPSDFTLLSQGDVSLRRMIGAGRMGKVYEAWQHAEGRAVAVKYLRKTCLREPSVVHRFLGEARTIAGLDHPHIVGLHALGHAPGGAYFLVMELVDGPNLALVGAARRLAVAEALRWTIQTCEALEHAHARKVIHCDLKPANLLLDGSGTIRVTDFGLARSLTGEAPWAAEVEGTAPFMAPEQASRAWGPISERTDIYGIGAVLYALLTGRPPWPGRRLSDILANVIGPVPVVPARHARPDLPVALDALCGKCLSKVPADRFETAQELRAALEEAASSPHQGTVHR